LHTFQVLLLGRTFYTFHVLLLGSTFYIQGIARPLKMKTKGKLKRRGHGRQEKHTDKQAREASREAKKKGEKDEHRQIRTGSETASVGLKGQSLTKATRKQTRT